MKLAYQAYDRAGHTVADVIDAPDVVQARDNLRRQGLFVTRIAPDAVPAPSRARRSFRGGNRLKHLSMFTRQLQVLLTTGTPLVQALTSQERQIRDPRFREVVADLRQRVEEGATLASAMEHHPRWFDSVSRSLVAAGESGGGLDRMLDRLARLVQRRLQLRTRVTGALMYPAVLISVSFSVLIMMLLFVLPRFGVLFESLGTPVPASTQFLLAFSDLLRHYGWILPLLLLGAFFASRSWLATAPGRSAIDRLLLSIPGLGPLIRGYVTARILRVMGVLVEAHVPLLEVLELTRGVTGNGIYASVIDTAHLAVTRGESISAAFDNPTLIDPSVHEAIHHGEQSGQIAPLLLTMADFLDEENDAVIKSLTSILEPAILVVLGLLVGSLALAMFVPLFDMAAAAQGGAG